MTQQTDSTPDAQDRLTPVETDVVVIGAGPVGLFQVFQLGLQGLACEVIDALAVPGGQCAELYADKPIYDIPALPVCTGTELVERLWRQIAPFHAGFHFGQQVEALTACPDGRFELLSSGGRAFVARAVVIAAGVGAFVPRRLRLPGLDELPAGRVSYAAPEPAAELAGEPAEPESDRPCVLVHGGDDRALEWACAAAAQGEPVALLYRRDSYPASAPWVDRIRAWAASGHVRLLVGQPSAVRALAGGIELDYTDASGAAQCVAARRLHVSLGLSPRLGPVAEWGLAMANKQLVVDTARFETALPGIHAVGDINTYPGKLKLIVCGFHEATLAAHAVAQRLSPQVPPAPLEYTTSSRRLQQRLGVATQAG
ncbi:MAG: NAD(P)/FAD-dependent oxidoreductase [Leptothrix sp. (in: b-proteobacteria)]